jgi:Sec-independent protein secretion pathway component TatC
LAPDVFSMTLLAVPMYLLYEAGLLMARVMLPEKTGAVKKEAKS